MKMKIDNNLVKSERKNRAWSQDHLAEVTGLGLRTIQRIEKTGTASYESAKALASVFLLDVNELIGERNSPQRANPARVDAGLTMKRMSAGFAATVLVAVTAVFFSSNGWADQVMLEIGVSQNEEEMTVGQLLTAEGNEAEMRINDVIRVIVSPTIQDDGRVFISAKIYEIVDGNSILLFEPKLITAHNEEAEIRIEADSGNSFRVLITPHISD